MAGRTCGLTDEIGPDEPLHDAVEFVSPGIEVHNFDWWFGPPTSQELIGSNGIHACLVVGDEKVMPQDFDICLLLFDAIRELLLNVVKHAHVGSAVVQADQRDDEWFQIIVKDEGVGYCPGRGEAEEGPVGGFGLSSIRRRVASVGGLFEVESTVGQGTVTMIRVPLRQE